MKDDFSVITLTGDRPIPFSICCQLMKNQTAKPVEWIIVDDGKTPTGIPRYSYINYIRRIRQPNEPPNSLPIQLKEALKHVTTDKVIIVEDDDWYYKEYLNITSKLLNIFDLVGNSFNIYYFIASHQYYEHKNDLHSSLCSTGFTKKTFPFFNNINLHDPYVDLRLWRSRSVINNRLYKPAIPYVLGIKELPGRVGPTYDSNRSCLRKGMQVDNNLNFFKYVVKNDYKLYEKYL